MESLRFKFAFFFVHFFLPVLQDADDDNEPDHGTSQRDEGHQNVLGRRDEQLHLPVVWNCSGVRVDDQLRVGNDLSPFLVGAFQASIADRVGEDSHGEMLDEVGRRAEADDHVGQLKGHVRGLGELGRIELDFLVLHRRCLDLDQSSWVSNTVRQVLEWTNIAASRVTSTGYYHDFEEIDVIVELIGQRQDTVSR